MAEGAGEDPFLGAAVARAMVRGYQGASLADAHTMMSCVKHFALYGASEAGLDYNTVDMSRLNMYNYYFAPYRAAIDEGAGSVMASFNVVDGIPATANRWLLTDVLRRQWGFEGFVVSDYTGVSEMTAHGMGDLRQVSALALHAGTDMDMVSEGYISTLGASVGAGSIDEAEIDLACRRILEAKYKLGLFDDPYRYCDKTRHAKEVFTADHRKTARRIAAETFVLLKNDDRLLPLQPRGKIAVVGPLADSRQNVAGCWSVTATPERYSTLLEGIRRAVGRRAEVVYAKGSNLMYDARQEAWGDRFETNATAGTDPQVLRDEALRVVADADVIIAAVGEAGEMSGECSSRSDLDLPDAQRDLLMALKQTGKPVVLLNFTGRPTTMNFECEQFATVLNVWYGGSEAADAIGDVLFGKVAPGGKLCASMPKRVGQLPLYYNHLNTGRPAHAGKWFEKFCSNYLDVDNGPLFPFGYGLSYTEFGYQDVRLSDSVLQQGGKVTLSVRLENKGGYDGAEVVQLYIRDMVGSISRPVQELKGFERVFLKRGESRVVRFEITPELLAFYNSELQLVTEPGDFEVMVGGNSRDVVRLRLVLQ